MVPFSYNLRSLRARRTTTLATALGIALVVFVLASALMLQKGIQETLASSGDERTALVYRKGADNEMSSSINEPTVGLIKSAPGVAKTASGAPEGVGEVVVVAFMEKVGADGNANVTLRGVPSDVLDFRPGVRIVDGRPAKPGVDEVIVGRAIRGRFKGVELGQSFEVRKGRMLEVVGIFEADGSAFESEIWGDLDTIRSSFGRQGIVSTVRVRLESASKFEAFQAAIEQDKRLSLAAVLEPEWYERQSEATAIFVGALGIVIAVFASIGAMIGAMITMYAAVATRKREIGVLRALGFSRPAILFSFLMESCVLALVGGAVGALGAIGMGMVKFSMMNFASWSQIVFQFHPTPQIIVTALIFGGAMGIAGGFFPALRAAKTSPIAAIRG